MKKLLAFFLFVIGIIQADYATAQQQVYVVKVTGSGNADKGKMPPQWLLNKVTPAQYDTLAILNRLCNVDYSMLKGYDVTQNDIANVMKLACENIRKALGNNDGATPNIVFKSVTVKQVSAWSDKVDKSTRKVDYLVYSSIDGYDVHLLLRTSLQRDRKTGGYRSVAYELVPYSVQGIPVTIERASVSKGGQPVERLEIGKDGKSASYAINATINFVDPLGNKHQELVSNSVILELER